MSDVSVREEDVVALLGKIGSHAGVHGPDFAGPAVWKRRGHDHIDGASVRACAESERNLKRSVGA